jgi:hypothetical protein
MALANTGLVLLGTISSKMLVPRRDDLLEMLEGDLAHSASQAWSAVEFKNPP